MFFAQVYRYIYIRICARQCHFRNNNLRAAGSMGLRLCSFAYLRRCSPGKCGENRGWVISLVGRLKNKRLTDEAGGFVGIADWKWNIVSFEYIF